MLRLCHLTHDPSSGALTSSTISSPSLHGADTAPPEQVVPTLVTLGA